jgi:hypothetical protein
MQRVYRGIPTLVEQIALASGTLEAEAKQRFNPRPPGVIREGSASEAVLMVLRSAPGFRTEGQLVFATKRSHAAVSWALLYLQQLGLVKAVPDVARNTRYKRYACVGDGR